MMRRFINLVTELDQTTSTANKVRLLVDYLSQETEEKDKLWMVALFTGKKPQKTVSTSLLRTWCIEQAGISLWLFEQNYHIIGDMAETMALILPRSESPSDKPLHLWMADIRGMSDTTEAKKKEFITNAWSVLDTPSIWVFNKLLTGGFRLGVTKSLMTQA
ncbi:MAG: ATP-dependent DNA ligase, partial [Saprospiraceae bacterium]